jgi:hypothetical protein
MRRSSSYTAVLTLAGLAVPAVIQAQERAQEQAQEPAGTRSIETAAQTPEGLIKALYGMVSIDPGPEPDWNMFRDVFLEEALLVFAPRGSQPMRPMSVDGFIQDWKDFFRDADLEERGFYETIAAMKVTEFGSLAHAFVIFEPRFGEGGPEIQLRGLDSIELSHDGTRWWVAAITTDFEGPDKTIPDDIVR